MNRASALFTRLLFPSLVLLAGAACRREARTPRGPGVITELFRDGSSDIARPAQWVVRTEAEWAGMKRRIGASAEAMRREVRPDFAREALVVAAAGEGSSGDPYVAFDGYRDEGGTRFVFIRYSVLACDAAQDVLTEVAVGVMPRWDGEVKLIASWIAPDC